MKKAFFLLVVLAVFITVPAFAGERSGTVTMKIDLSGHAGEGAAKLWLPYPASDDFQTINNIRIRGDVETMVFSDAARHFAVLFVEFPGGPGHMELSFDATAHERSKGELKESEGPHPSRVDEYLEPNRWIPTDGEILKTAKTIIGEEKGYLARARAVYDWVVENTYRDPHIKGCGLGSVEKTLAERGGKCADISSVFVALSRAAGVPAREVFGLRLSKEDEQDMTGGYHCWAEFYLPGTGWVPVDPADVRKLMLVEKLELKEAGKYREYYFGSVDEFRIILGRAGRDVVLIPEQSGDPINYFMYPYAEIDGKPLDYLDPASFIYSVTFQAR